MSDQWIIVRRVGAFAVSILAAGALVACSQWPSGDQPAPVPAPVSGAAAQSEPDYQMQSGYRVGHDGKLLPPDDLPAEPKLPKAAEENSEAGARAFAKYFLDLAGYSWNTGDTAALAEISIDPCVFCFDLIRKINTHYGNGNWVAGFEYRMTSDGTIAPYPGKEGCEVMTFKIRQFAGDVYLDGRLGSIGDEDLIMEFHPCFNDGRWTATGALVVEDDQG